jgi:hypothetical protein
VPPNASPVSPTATATAHKAAAAPASATATLRVVVVYKTVPKTVTRYQTVRRYETIKRYQTITRYKTIPRYQTITRYKTIPRYQTVRRYETIPRYQTLIRYKTLYRTVLRYLTLNHVHVTEAVRTIVNHKMVVTVTTRIVTRAVVRHRTVVSIVYAVRVMGHPKTGRLAAPQATVRLSSVPAPDAYVNVPRLGISYAPVWTRGYTNDGYGGFTYDIVPYYGVTRFLYSVPFGTPGTTMVYGHDDIYGNIFRYLGVMRVGDEIGVVVGHHRFVYVVRSNNIVRPDDVRLVNAVHLRPTLVLISCTPYWVDSQRVVVVAELK